MTHHATRVGPISIVTKDQLLLLVLTGASVWVGLSAEQSRMTALFGIYSLLGAPVIAEVLSRGCLAIEHRGRAALWGGVMGASVLFALLHPFL